MASSLSGPAALVRPVRKTMRLLGALLTGLAAAGCASIGPATVSRDRIDYVSAVGNSWKEQTLLNVVRLRYGDPPSFFEVSSVISGYALQGQVAAGGIFSSNAPSVPSTVATLNGNLTYLDRPTITYTPLSGDKFAKSMLRPLPPSEIFELIQAGYPVDAVLQMTTRALNGIFNRSNIGGVREADAEFYPLLDSLRRLQRSGAVSLRLETRDSEEIGHLIFSSRQSSSQVQTDLVFVEKTLDINLDRNSEVTVAFGAIPRDRQEIAVLTRSMMEILLEVAAGIDVPAEDVSTGLTAAAGRPPDAENPRDRPLIAIHSGGSQPSRAYAAVRYGDTWYWIDAYDLPSKRVFTFLMMFFSLAETGVLPQTPMLTVPAS